MYCGTKHGKEIYDLSNNGIIYYEERAGEIYEQMRQLTLMNNLINYIYIVVDHA